MPLVYIRHGDDELDQAAVAALARAGHRVPEHDPPLNPRGVARARRAAEVLIRLYGHPDVVYCSPFERARQTVAAMVGAFRGTVYCGIDPGLSRYFSREEQKRPRMSPPTIAACQVPIHESGTDFAGRVDRQHSRVLACHFFTDGASARGRRGSDQGAPCRADERCAKLGVAACHSRRRRHSSGADQGRFHLDPDHRFDSQDEKYRRRRHRHHHHHQRRCSGQAAGGGSDDDGDHADNGGRTGRRTNTPGGNCAKASAIDDRDAGDVESTLRFCDRTLGREPVVWCVTHAIVIRRVAKRLGASVPGKYVPFLGWLVARRSQRSGRMKARNHHGLGRGVDPLDALKEAERTYRYRHARLQRKAQARRSRRQPEAAARTQTRRQRRAS
jgi:hypothetical protein